MTRQEKFEYAFDEGCEALTRAGEWIGEYGFPALVMIVFSPIWLPIVGVIALIGKVSIRVRTGTW